VLADRDSARRPLRQQHVPERKEVAAKHGPAALLQEKPLNDINGSGKHHNWSIAPAPGVNLLDAEYVLEATKYKHVCPIVMAAVIAAVDEHGDLIGGAIASPGNDFRFGAFGIVSTYLGQAMTNVLEAETTSRTARAASSLETKEAIPFEVTTGDRNRTRSHRGGQRRRHHRPRGPQEALERRLQWEQQKYMKLFEKTGVITVQERQARQTVLLDHNVGTVEMETSCFDRHDPAAHHPVRQFHRCASSFRAAGGHQQPPPRGDLSIKGRAGLLPTRKTEAKSQL
jgi:glutamine synthetase type III